MATLIRNSAYSPRFGIASNETGLIIESVDQTASLQTTEIKSLSGDTVAVGMFGQTSDATCTGYWTSSATNITLGASYALANDLNTAWGCGTYYVTGVQANQTPDGFVKFTLTLKAWKGLV